jgi:predicted RNase H-like nuclease (RuvC/YqgF family)
MNNNLEENLIVNLQILNDQYKKDLQNSKQLISYLEDILEKQKEEIGNLHSKINKLEEEKTARDKINNRNLSTFEYLKSFIKY